MNNGVEQNPLTLIDELRKTALREEDAQSDCLLHWT